VQHATEPLASTYPALAIRSLIRLNQLVADALMISLAMVVGHESALCDEDAALPAGSPRSTHSSLIDRTSRVAEGSERTGSGAPVIASALRVLGDSSKRCDRRSLHSANVERSPIGNRPEPCERDGFNS